PVRRDAGPRDLGPVPRQRGPGAGCGKPAEKGRRVPYCGGIAMRTVVGITGGTGCGKTTVLTVLQAMGFSTIDCDALYHQMLEEGGKLVEKIGELFPGTVENGVLHRKRLGNIVFEDPDALARLSAITDEAVDKRVQ